MTWRLVALLLAVGYLAAGVEDHHWFRVVCGALILLLAALDALLDKVRAKQVNR